MKSNRRYTAFVALLGALFLFNGCDRPFADPATPEVSILSPDFSELLPSPNIRLKLSTSGFRPVSSVMVNGNEMSEEPQTGNWEFDLVLGTGVNPLQISVTDVDGGITDTTEYAVFMPFLLTPRTNVMLTATGGHAATATFTGSLLVTGGTEAAGGQATRRAEILPASATVFQTMSASLVHARTGHSATLLPDGRILIAGGSSTDEIASISDLVEEPEIFNPDDLSFEPMVFVGEPIRRSFHTASVRRVNGSTILDLYGGRGDIQYLPEPRLGTRADIRSFLVKGDTLEALSPAVGPNLSNAISGHTQTPLSDDLFSPNRYLIAGSYFIGQAREDVGFTVDFSAQQGIVTDEIATFATPRTRHAAARMANEVTVLWGGRQANEGSALNDAELYIQPANRFITIPFDGTVMPVKRFGHSAVVQFPGRLVIVGGYSNSGVAIPHAEILDYQL